MPCYYTLEQRFWKKVDKTDTCWEWIGAIAGRRYGCFWDGRRLVYAHRVAYEIAYGPIPDGLDVLHHCDNPRCVRHDHLFLGTHQDNMDDMMIKGRGNRIGNKKRAMRVSLTCDTCGKIFERDESAIRNSIKWGMKRVFCSRPCFWASYYTAIS